jgi:hypothetical protein
VGKALLGTSVVALGGDVEIGTDRTSTGMNCGSTDIEVGTSNVGIMDIGVSVCVK